MKHNRYRQDSYQGGILYEMHSPLKCTFVRKRLNRMKLTLLRKTCLSNSCSVKYGITSGETAVFIMATFLQKWEYLRYHNKKIPHIRITFIRDLLRRMFYVDSCKNEQLGREQEGEIISS